MKYLREVWRSCTRNKVEADEIIFKLILNWTQLSLPARSIIRAIQYKNGRRLRQYPFSARSGPDSSDDRKLPNISLAVGQTQSAPCSWTYYSVRLQCVDGE